ncbi:short-chain dehydrogenase [Sulfitobacter sp. JL08]|uniref:SDR family NAD(P)-dependent oxidoreductase n=1 Tax=Sulfitobacter sp. JL08 TaxID=2070369 RepID=UPI000E0B5618|nr:SDR family oxidoreductase [Sulfitobacter sp. JL08]AXI53823.1 short-chain dehydrogenase [Sulfitobacter sp. JL08]
MANTVERTPPRQSVVTGASSGLGLAFAEHLAQAGSDLVLVARDQSRLEACAGDLAATHGVKVRTIPADLSNSVAAGRVFSQLRDWDVTADVLVNNAGFNVYGRFEETRLEREIEMIRLHTIAVAQLTKGFLLDRKRTHRNRIVNVSSIAALVPGPFVSVHFATRAHLLSFSLALAEEYRGTDVDVTCLCPGPMRTDFFRRAGMSDVRLASGWPMQTMSPSEVAKDGFDAMMKGKRMTIPGWRNKLFSFAAEMAPRPLRSRFTKWIMDRVEA